MCAAGFLLPYAYIRLYCLHLAAKTRVHTEVALTLFSSLVETNGGGGRPPRFYRTETGKISTSSVDTK